MPVGARRVLREGLLYGVIGGFQLVVDWLSFFTLTSLGVAVVPANVTGRIVGACFGFWLNGRFTFSRRGQAPPLGRPQLLRFVVVWLAAAALSTSAVWALAHMQGLWAAWVGKFMVDGLLAGASFLLSKYWVYR